jgi:hypothetical protein
MLQRALMLCRHACHAAVAERRAPWHRCGVTVTCCQQKAEMPMIKEAMPEYGEVNAQVWQRVVLRVDRAFQDFLRRICEAQTLGYPRFCGRGRGTSFTYLLVGEHGGARLDTGFLILSGLVASSCAGRVHWA